MKVHLRFLVLWLSLPTNKSLPLSLKDWCSTRTFPFFLSYLISSPAPTYPQQIDYSDSVYQFQPGVWFDGGPAGSIVKGMDVKSSYSVGTLSFSSYLHYLPHLRPNCYRRIFQRWSSQQPPSWWYIFNCRAPGRKRVLIFFLSLLRCSSS